MASPHRTRRAAALCAVAALLGRSQGFDTALGGSANEQPTFSTLGAGVLQLGQPPLTEFDPDAVCMDGSPAGYYWQAGSDTSLYVVYAEGGYWCWDEASCQERCSATSFACSSSGWSSQIALEGLFSALPSGNDNPFATANKVYLKYCSSDSWLGDAPASDATFGYAFRGSRIVTAAIASLKATRGLGASAGQRLIFGGCSAGGRGAMGMLDSVAALLPGVDVRGFFDASAWVDIEPQIQGLQSLQSQAALQVSFLQPPLPTTCTALYSGNELWKCIWPSYRLPLLSTPFFLNAASWDTFQIMYTTNNAPGPGTPGGIAFLNSFQTATRELFSRLPAGTSVFSTSCMAHCLADSLELFCYSVDGRTLAQALGGWMDTGAQSLTKDACTGWNCTHKCGPGPMATWVPENEPPNSSPLCAAYYSSIQQNDRALAASGASAPPQLGLGPAPAPRGEEDKAATGLSAGAAAAPAAAPKWTGVVSASEPALSAVQQAKLAALVA